MNQNLKKIRQILAGLLLITAAAGFTSCEKYQWAPVKVDPEVEIFFQKDIQPILTAKCATCHTATKAPDLRDGKSFAALTKGAYITLPGDASKLYTKMIGNDHSARSSDVDKQSVLNWINQGAKNN